MRTYGLIGHPLGHSFSKKYFEEKFARESIADTQFNLYDLAQISDISTVLTDATLRGFCVTIPYKKEILPYLHEQDAVVQKIGACNCVSIRNGKLYGSNTDVVGFRESLKPFLKSHHNHALILGSGGAAAAVRYVLDELHITYESVTRSGTGLQFESLTAEHIAHAPLIINTTPLGTYPDITLCPPIPYEALTSRHHLYDMVYNPAETQFMKRGMSYGATAQNGYEMLVLQAEENWRRWNI